MNELVQRDDLGLERGDTTLTGLVEGRARIPVGLNRTGGVGLTLAVRSRGRVSLRWNGTLLVEQLIDGRSVLRVRACDLERGLNWLEIAGPVGTAIGSIDLVARPTGWP